MTKMRNWMVGLAAVSLLAVGAVALAGNGFGSNDSWIPAQASTGDCDVHERDADGDGILNSEDTDRERPLDGSGYGLGQGANGSGSRPLDGTGFGASQNADRDNRTAAEAARAAATRFSLGRRAQHGPPPL